MNRDDCRLYTRAQLAIIFPSAQFRLLFLPIGTRLAVFRDKIGRLGPGREFFISRAWK